MEAKDFRELFNKFDVYTLYSIGYLFGLAKEIDGIPSAVLTNVMCKKIDEDRDNFEGMEEYDDITIMLNFDISEVMNNMDKLNANELEYMRNLVGKALGNIKEKRKEEAHVMTNLEEFINRCDNKSSSLLLETIDDDYTDKELRDFFNKYSVQELESFRIIFGYAIDFNLNRIFKAYNEVLKEKQEELRKEYEVPITPLGYRISNLSFKNKNLSVKELRLLGRITESSSMCLDSVADRLDLYHEYKEVSTLNDSIDKEISKRESDFLQEARERGFILKNPNIFD